jgi:UDP-2,4-diacetamido-2,4,6-trideoxy-beta-L-altropyranose hydrolase
MDDYSTPASAASGRRIAIRVDASVQMGTGHLRRCMTLAESLREGGYEPTFVTRDLGLDNAATLAATGHAAITLPPPNAAFASGANLPPHAAWAEVGWEHDAAQTIAALRTLAPAILVVDHYAFDSRWHEAVAGDLEAPLVAVDDLGDRPLAVSLIVDPTMASHADKYRLSAPWHPRILGGPQYALLAPAYSRLPAPTVRERVQTVGLFMGGSDLANASEIAWQATRSALGPAVQVTIATTSANPHKARLEDLATSDNATTLLVDLPDLAGFFASHDLQIGAGGGATWERCCAGAPTILVAFADNHLPVARPLHEMGVLLLSEDGATRPEALARDIAELAASSTRRLAMSQAGRKLVDGAGLARVRKAIDDLAQD